MRISPETSSLNKRSRLFYKDLYFLLYPMQSMGESIGIGLEASSPSKGSQAKTTEPMDSTKVTYFIYIFIYK